MRNCKGIAYAVVLKGGPVKPAKKFASDINWRVSKSSPTWFFPQFRAACFYFTCSEAAEADLSGCCDGSQQGQPEGAGNGDKGGQAPRRSFVEAGAVIHWECWSLDGDLWLSTAPEAWRARLQTEQLKTPQPLLLLGHGRVLLWGLAALGVSTAPFYSS